MPASKPTDDLRRQAAELILDRLKTASVAQVAKQLGISRQAVYDIRRGKYCPSLPLIQKACQVWDVKFSYRGLAITKGSFNPMPTKVGEVQPSQGDLLEAFSRIGNESFEIIGAKPMGRALEITLRLTLPARRTAGG